MSQEELQQVKDTLRALNEFREQEDKPEDLARIPLLTRADLKKEAAPLIYEERTLGDTPLIYHNLFTKSR